MLQILRNQSIVVKVALLALVPAIGLVWQAAPEIGRLNQRIEDSTMAANYVDAAVKIARAMHELQAERGLSAARLASGEARFTAALPKQRARTNAALGRARGAIALVDFDGDVPPMLARLPGMRAAVNRQSASPETTVEAYTEINLLLVDHIGALGLRTPSAPLSRGLIALYTLQRLKDSAGRERAAGVIGLGAGWNELRRQHLAEQVESQRVLLSTLLMLTDDKRRRQVADLSRDPIVQRLATMRESLFRSDVTHPTLDRWFDSENHAIEGLHAIADGLVADIEATARDELAAARNARNMLLLVLALATGLGLGLVVFISRDLVRSVRAVGAAMGDIVSGRLEGAPVAEARRDEIGQMNRALESFREAAREKRRGDEQMARTMVELEEAMAEKHKADALLAEERRETVRLLQDELGGGLQALRAGRLGHRIAGTFPHEYEALKRDFNAAMENLTALIAQVSRSAGSVMTGAGQIRSGADDLARRSEAQAMQMQQSSATLERISNEMIDAQGHCDAARDAAREMAVEGDRGSRIVGEAIGAMQSIRLSSDRIGQITGTIRAIATQTNLLALNAGVEAARAGDAGKGFIIVAQEVRALAKKTSEAVAQIAELASESRKQTSAGVELVNRTGESLSLAAARMAQVVSGVEDLSGMVRQHAGALATVNGAMLQIDTASQANAAMAEETHAAIVSLADEAVALGRVIEAFDTAPEAARPRPAPYDRAA